MRTPLPALILFLTTWLPLTVRGQQEAMPDSVKLSEVVVTARSAKADVIPVQTLKGEELQRLNTNSVADALRYFSGVQVKDYGGVGGIKTVNIRSMGTNHTGVVYDGVALGNAQNGQIDLGQFSLDNMESLSLHNGQKSRILQPASDFGNAGQIYMTTRRPRFAETESYHVRGTLRFGSFSLLNPSAVVELKLSQNVNASLSAEWLNSSGKYRFRYRRKNPSGEVAYDTTATRQNGDVNATRLELNLFGNTRIGTWTLKGYNYNSERGVPGAIVNNVWRRGERIWDTNSFVQGNGHLFAGRWSGLLTAKYAFYRTHYVNNDDKQMRVDNLYRQREVYFSSANSYSLVEKVNLALAYDFKWNSLLTDVAGFAKPDRFTNLVSLAADVNLGRFQAQGSALATFVHDRIEGKPHADNRQAFTPALYLSGYPLRSTDLSLRAFYKKSFRMPTFNDLYYADMGNSRLDPEHVAQYNLGAVYDKGWSGKLISALRVSADAYYNRVKNKIVAYPKGQQFRWTMLNLGKVDIRGIDLSALITLSPAKELDITLRCQYTWQRAIDVTDPADNYYRDQIPYIPRHSGSAVVNLQWREWGLNYSWIYVGGRYSQQENIRYNYVQPWYTSDLSVSRDFRFNNVHCRALVEVNNLFSQDYDVILNYPMPKRNFRITLSVDI